MKYVAITILLMVLGGFLFVEAFTDIASSQYLGKTKELKAYTVIDANFATVPANVDTNTTIDTTDTTPRYIGDMLIGSVSNVVYVSSGTATSDWILVTN